MHAFARFQIRALSWRIGIANQAGHRSMPVLRGYIRRANMFEENAAVSVVT